MKKAKTRDRQNRLPAGAFSETIAIVQKALVDALPFDILAREEIAAIKSGLRELRDGAVRIVPFFGIDALDELWPLDPHKIHLQEAAEIESVLPRMEESPEELRLEEEAVKEELQPLSWEQERFPAPPPEVREAALPEKEEFKTELSLAVEQIGPLRKAEERSWDIAMPETFTKSIRGLDKKLQGRILEALGKIVKDPLKEIGDTVKPLSRDKKGLWRYRIGDYRLVYRPEVETSRVVLLTCGARGTVYD